MITCKHCGAGEGFYTRQQVSGTAVFHYTKEGHLCSENGQAHEELRYKGGKNAYCLQCDRIIGKSDDFISGLEEG